MNRFLLWTTTVVCLTCASHAAGQTAPTLPPPPGEPASTFTPATLPGGAVRPGMSPRDPNRPAPTGTSRLRGRVVAAEGGGPLRRAAVTLTAPEMQIRRSTTTDATGSYEFAELPAGRYSINVTKTGYVSLQYGQRRPYEPGTAVVLTDGQTLASVNVSLPRGSVIAGRISDEFGEPIAQAQLQALRYQYGPDGQRRLQTTGLVTTDDLGQFRLFGLMPGEYVVSASSMNLAGMSIGGAANDSSEGYLPTYYPGTPNPDEAQPISVGIGQETNIQFSLTGARMSRISGQVVDSTGRPVVGAMIMLRSGSPTSSVLPTFSAGQSGADGSFTLSNVAPGDHVIDVRPSALRAGPDSAPESASMPVSVPSAGLTGVRIVTGRGATVRGRVVFEGSASRTGPTPIRVFPQPVVAGNFAINVSGAANGVVADDETFELGGMTGQFYLRVATPPAWTLKSISAEGEDVTDKPLDVNGRQTLTGVRVVLTDKLTDVSGSVADSRGQVLKDYVVVILPTEQKDGIAATRFMRVLRPDQDGRFRVRGLPTGSYIATAVESLEQGRHFVPEVQTRLRAAGRKFSLTEGQNAALDLPLTSGFD